MRIACACMHPYYTCTSGLQCNGHNTPSYTNLSCRSGTKCKAMYCIVTSSWLVIQWSSHVIIEALDFYYFQSFSTSFFLALLMYMCLPGVHMTCKPMCALPTLSSSSMPLSDSQLTSSSWGKCSYIIPHSYYTYSYNNDQVSLESHSTFVMSCISPHATWSLYL